MTKRGFFALMFPAAGCKRAPKDAGPVHAYNVRGEVIRVTQRGRLAVVKHEAIKDDTGVYWMAEMTMEFPVKDPVEFSQLRAGQQIRAQLVQRLDTLEYWLEQIQVTAAP
jgi:Cu/Ag efflux protein CusF